MNHTQIRQRQTMHSRSVGAGILGFTLIEALAALLVVGIGFSALFFWFRGHAMVTVRESTRYAALREAVLYTERAAAFPGMVRDSVWTTLSGADSLRFEVQVVDSADLEDVSFQLGQSWAQRERLLNRPPEVEMSVYRNGTLTVRLHVIVGIN